MTDPVQLQQPSLVDEAIRNLVRDEVRAELAKVPALQAPAVAPYVSVTTYAEARSISVSTVRHAIRDGRLPAMKIGTAVRVRNDAEIGASVVPVVKHPGPTPAQVADRVLAKRPRIARVHQRMVTNMSCPKDLRETVAGK
jgi:excisionase family DNA binding protein